MRHPNLPTDVFGSEDTGKEPTTKRRKIDVLNEVGNVGKYKFVDEQSLKA